MRKLRAGASPANTPGSPGPRWFRRLPGAARIVAAARSQTAKTLNFPGELETIEQLKFLEEHGCDQVQGFLISRPVEAAAAERLLENPVLLDPRPEHRPLLAAAADG